LSVSLSAAGAAVAFMLCGQAGLGADAPKPSAAATAAELAAAAEEIVKSLEPTVASPQAFKQGEEEVEHKAYVIALVANAVADAEGEARWKSAAVAVRDAALDLAKTKNQANAAKTVKAIQDLMNGGGAAASGKPMPFLQVASLTHVMKEVNERNRALTKNTRSTQFARKKDDVARDAQMLALLGAIARADTKSAEDAKKPQADFEKFADDLVHHSKTLASAAKKADASAVSESYKAVKKACADCHLIYRPDIE
jgi:hypothetical protein